MALQIIYQENGVQKTLLVDSATIIPENIEVFDEEGNFQSSGELHYCFHDEGISIDLFEVPINDNNSEPIESTWSLCQELFI